MGGRIFCGEIKKSENLWKLTHRSVLKKLAQSAGSRQNQWAVAYLKIGRLNIDESITSVWEKSLASTKKKKMSLDMFPYKWVPKSGSCFWFCSCSCSCFCFCSCSCSCSCSWSWACSCPPFCHRSLATTNQPQTHSDIKASQPASHQTSKHHSDCRSSRLVQQQANSKAKKQPSNHTSKLIQSSFYIYFSAFRASPLAKEERFINIKYYNAIKGERSPNFFF